MKPRIDTLKFVQDNHMTLRPEELALKLNVERGYLRRQYPAYIFEYSTILYHKSYQLYLLKNKYTGKISFQTREPIIPPRFKKTIDGEFIRWQSPFHYKSKVIEDTLKVRLTQNATSELEEKGEYYYCNEATGDIQVLKTKNKRLIAEQLNISLTSVYKYIKIKRLICMTGEL